MDYQLSGGSGYGGVAMQKVAQVPVQAFPAPAPYQNQNQHHHQPVQAQASAPQYEY
jgi:hypothetical protein